MDRGTGEILAGPDILSRGFLRPEDSSEIFEGACERVVQSLEELNLAEDRDLDTVRVAVHDAAARYLRKRTNRRPVVIPVIMEV